MHANLKFSTNLAFLLEEKKVSRTEFGQATGLSPSHIQNYLNGTVPRAATFLTIANYFEVTDLAALLDGTPEDLVASRTAPAKFGLIRE